MSKLDKREGIVRAALELIAEQGFHGCPMAMIAERAGVAAGTIYRYFENKDALITGLYGDFMARLTPVLLEGYMSGRPVRERFVHLGTKLLRYLAGHPLDFKFAEQFHNSPYGVALRREKLYGKREELSFFIQLFEDGIAQQVMKDLPLPVLLALFFGPIMDVVRDNILEFIKLDDALIVRTIEACWDGVRR